MGYVFSIFLPIWNKYIFFICKISNRIIAQLWMDGIAPKVLKFEFIRLTPKSISIFYIWKVSSFVYVALKLCGAVGNVIRKFLWHYLIWNTTVPSYIDIVPSHFHTESQPCKWCHVANCQSEISNVEMAETWNWNLSNCKHTGRVSFILRYNNEECFICFWSLQ